jgi:hypothetical protein
LGADEAIKKTHVGDQDVAINVLGQSHACDSRPSGLNITYVRLCSPRTVYSSVEKSLKAEVNKRMKSMDQWLEREHVSTNNTQEGSLEVAESQKRRTRDTSVLVCLGETRKEVAGLAGGY